MRSVVADAGRCAQYMPKLVLAQCLADPALGEFVLADDALGIDPEQCVDPVPGPLRDLGWVDAAVEPRRQASMEEVVGLNVVT